MNVTDDKNRGAFMLGGGGSDNLTGGTGNDLLIGNAGSDELYGGAGVDTLLGNAGIDVLTGGLGNDTLLGGAGDDTYVYATGDGTDIIMDSDGQGSITYDGFTLRGGKQFGDTRVHQDKANHHLYVQADTDTLIIDGNIIIKNYIADSGALSLTMTGPEADIIPDIQTSNTINGDKQQASLDDSIIDTTANDLINAGAGSDWVSKSAGGDDIINLGDGNDVLITQYYDAGKLIANGGKGRDYLGAGAGNDTINGGDGNDYIEGNAGQNTLKGEAGNDVLVGGTDVDILDGGTGNDQLKGGDGVDVYQFKGDYGTDIITDSDGQGIITVDNTLINGGQKIAEGIYRNESTHYTYTLASSGNTQSLFIHKDDSTNNIIIRNSSTTKNLNITLDDAQAAPPQGTLSGDFSKKILFAANDNFYREVA
jgi:Ca2+-binding RTX toxin-like protein